MDEEAKKAPDTNVDEPKADESKNQQPDPQKEQERIDKIINERLKREREKFDERLKAELAEQQRLAKLSAEEKEAEERKRREQETAERERGIILRENRADAREILQEKNISTDLVDFVVDVDPDKTKENINNLEAAFTKAVEAGIADRLKGQTPTDKSTKQTAPKITTGTVSL